MMYLQNHSRSFCQQIQDEFSLVASATCPISRKQQHASSSGSSSSSSSRDACLWPVSPWQRPQLLMLTCILSPDSCQHFNMQTAEAAQMLCSTDNSSPHQFWPKQTCMNLIQPCSKDCRNLVQSCLEDPAAAADGVC